MPVVSAPRIHTVGDTLANMGHQLPAGAVPEASLARVTRVAETLPAAVTDWVYLECRLTPGDRQVDLILGVDERGRPLLAGDSERFAPALDPLLRHPAWRRVRAFAREWADPASPLHRSVRRIWLEFDIADDPPSIPVPGVFVDFTPEAYSTGTARERWELALATVRPLLQHELPGATRDNLRRCFEELPEGCEALYTGVLLSRELPAVRLCVNGLRGDALVDYLRRVRWPGDGAELMRAIGPLYPGDETGADPATLHIDVGESVYPRIGLEYPLDRRSQFGGELRERATLDALIQRGLCTEEKRDGLCSWPGYSRGVLPHEFWPSLRLRRVNHLKAMYAPGRPLEVKAYLCFHHSFRRSAARSIA